MMEDDPQNPTSTEEYVLLALDGFVGDPPDSDFQSGYLAALKAVAVEGMGLELPDRIRWVDEPRKPPVLRVVR